MCSVCLICPWTHRWPAGPCFFIPFPLPPVVIAEIIAVLGSALFEEESDEGGAGNPRVSQMKAEEGGDQSENQDLGDGIFPCERRTPSPLLVKLDVLFV